VPSGQAARRFFVVGVTALVLAGCSSGRGDSAAGPASAGSATSGPGAGRPSVSAVPPPVETASPSVGVRTVSPVPVGRTVALTGQLRVTVGSVRTLRVEARGPGETAGSAVVVPITLANGSSGPFDTGGLVINAFYGKGTPAVPTTADPARPIRGTLAPSRTARGEYVFRVPASAGANLRVEVSYPNAPAVAVFTK
jgi:hypothetical protein